MWLKLDINYLSRLKLNYQFRFPSPSLLIKLYKLISNNKTLKNHNESYNLIYPLKRLQTQKTNQNLIYLVYIPLKFAFDVKIRGVF